MAMKYRAFWEALVVSLFIFGLGFVLGVLLENSRSQDLGVLYAQSETDLLDAQILSSMLENSNYSCEKAIQKNTEFGDKIYSDSVKLEEYSGSSQLSRLTDSQHRKYDLLRTIFWVNSIKITEQCGKRFHTVVYLYDYNTDNIEEKSKQAVFSRALTELKEEFGSELILIPIAKNMGLSSLDLMLEKYSLTGTTILLDENQVFSSVETLSNLKSKLASDRVSILLN
ncbi:hypothetical protein KA107_02855 [Candidatus Pacearchaeota archaeon]|nr:hypothetical protein [Candidatus Pacearchaeota archaeon]